MEIKDRKINELIEENHVFASILFYFGISFYEYPNKTLSEVCEIRGIKENDLIESLENSTKSRPANPEFSQLPVDMVVEYAKHKHQHYLSITLPYISKLLDGYNFVNPISQAIVQKLRTEFLIFSKGFIDQIHFQEKNIFDYILLIEDAFRNNNFGNANLFFALEKKSNTKWTEQIIPLFYGLKTLQEIIRGYDIEKGDLFLNVICSELEDFANQLGQLAQIEKDTLLPRALNIEREIIGKIRATIPLN